MAKYLGAISGSDAFRKELGMVVGGTVLSFSIVVVIYKKSCFFILNRERGTTPRLLIRMPATYTRRVAIKYPISNRKQLRHHPSPGIPWRREA